MQHETELLIVDLNGQYTALIAKCLRDEGYRSVIHKPEQAVRWEEEHSPLGIIFSGGSQSVYDSDAPDLPDELLDSPAKFLGICYGMQQLAWQFGGKVEPVDEGKEYGPREFELYHSDNPLFRDIPQKSSVLLSHRDSVVMLPDGFRADGRTERSPIAAFSAPDAGLYGVLFHPEVSETVYGRRILGNFALMCGATKNWDPGNIVEELKGRLRAADRPDAKWGVLFSSGVDSSVVAFLCNEVFGERATAFTLNTGHFRGGEADEIVRNAKLLRLRHVMIDAEQKFLDLLAGTTDAQTKRQRFHEGYREEAEKIMREYHIDILAQGTLYPDVRESGDGGQSALIKDHHNIGVTSVDVLSDFVKGEVRELARSLGLPEHIASREPFPGPGLSVRILGMPATREALDLLRWADGKVRDIITVQGLIRDISQLVVMLVQVPTAEFDPGLSDWAALLAHEEIKHMGADSSLSVGACMLKVQTPGIKGDARSEGHPVLVFTTPVRSGIDTNTLLDVPFEIQERVTNMLTTEEEIIRVWFGDYPKIADGQEFFNAIVVRPVVTDTFMTARGYGLPPAVIAHIAHVLT